MSTSSTSPASLIKKPIDVVVEPLPKLQSDTINPRKKLTHEDKTLTTRRRRLLEAHSSSPKFMVNSKNNINSSQIDTDSQKISGISEKNKSLKNSSNSKHSDIRETDGSSSDDDNSAVVSDADSSDDDQEDLIPAKRREKLKTILSNLLLEPQGKTSSGKKKKKMK